MAMVKRRSMGDNALVFPTRYYLLSELKYFPKKRNYLRAFGLKKAYFNLSCIYRFLIAYIPVL